MGLFSSLLPVAGGIAGGVIGGPAGAMIGSQVGSGIGGYFNQRSSDKAMRQNQGQIQDRLNQISGIGKQYYEPYIGQGQEAGNRANQEYSKLLDDPTGFVNAIMQSYQPSSGYQFKEDRLKRSAANTSAAGGFAGTQYDSDNQTALVNSLMSEDMQQYLSNILGVHGKGLAGKELVAGRGYDASTGLADFLGSNMGQQAGVDYRFGQDRNAGRNNYNDQMLQLGGQIGGGLWNQNTPGKVWDGRAPQQPQGGVGPTIGGYGGPYRNNVPGAAWVR